MDQLPKHSSAMIQASFDDIYFTKLGCLKSFVNILRIQY